MSRVATAPVEAPSKDRDIKPEWLRVSEVRAVFGLPRSTVFALIAENKVKSIHFRKRGSQRGIRLVSYDSLDELMAEAAKDNGI